MSRPGKISVFYQNPTQLVALLYNYDVNSATPKPEHIRWLEKYVKPHRTRKMTAVIVGLASRTGSNSWNFKLSRIRASVISDKIFLLKAGSLTTDTRIAFGEEAARIAGLQDRIEDERWRGVLISIHDPKTPPPPPKPKPHPTIWRRTYVRVLVYDKPGKYVPMDPIDRRAEGIFQASQSILRHAGAVDNILDEQGAWINGTWTLHTIGYKTNTSKSGAWKHKELEVSYQWGPPGPKCVLWKIGTVLNKDRRTIGVDEMNKWLKHPLAAYLWD